MVGCRSPSWVNRWQNVGLLCPARATVTLVYCNIEAHIKFKSEECEFNACDEIIDCEKIFNPF